MTQMTMTETPCDRLTPEQSALVESHLSVAESAAVKMYRRAPNALNLDDLKGAAYLGLVMAAQRWETYCDDNQYDPGATHYFKAYASRRCAGAILDSLRKLDWVPRSEREKHKRMPDTEQRDVRRVVSLDTDQHDQPHGDTDVEQQTVVSSILVTATATIARMSDLHQTVMALHYFSGLELQEIARLLKITDSRASHIHTEAVLEVHGALAVAATAV